MIFTNNQYCEPVAPPRIGMVYCQDCGQTARMDEARIVVYDDYEEMTICNNCPDSYYGETVIEIKPVTEPDYLEDVEPYQE
jgi:hypothetical protein